MAAANVCESVRSRLHMPRQARLQRLESGQYTGASGCRSARKTCSLMDESLEPSACAMSAGGARMKAGTQQARHSPPP